MELESLKKAWQHRTVGAFPEWPIVELVSSIQAKLKRFNRIIFWRDVREIGLALVLILFFGRLIWTARSVMSRMGAGVIIAGLILVIAKLLRARLKKRKGKPEANIKEFFSAERDGIDAQIRLLRSVPWWYLGPLIFGVNVFFVGARGLSLASFVYLIATLILAAFIYRLNLMAVKKQLQPLREELNRLLHDLEDGPNDTRQESNSKSQEVFHVRS